jgi:creatinine amidohydrolase
MTLYEFMRPDEVVGAREAAAIAYVPVGPLEWHGPHLPLGVDGLHAHEAAVRAATETGGVVLPTLFAGTETVRLPGSGPQSLEPLGLSTEARIVGMDFPGNPVRSTYFEESAFGVSVRELVRNMLASDYRVIVIVNGHGAVNHQTALRRIAVEADRPESQRVVYHLAFLPEPDASGPAHAARVETAIMLAISPGQVRCDLLPPDGAPLRYADFGIVDARAFDGHPAPGLALPASDHPRVATAEMGDAILAAEGRALAQRVRALLEEIPAVAG